MKGIALFIFCEYNLHLFSNKNGSTDVRSVDRIALNVLSFIISYVAVRDIKTQTRSMEELLSWETYKDIMLQIYQH